MNIKRSPVLIGMCLLMVSPCVVGQQRDWPQWRGLHQDGISRETGLLASWPEGGPPELWRIRLGAGYSAVSVVGGKAYTMYGADTGAWGVWAGVGDGKILWRTRRAGRGTRAGPRR